MQVPKLYQQEAVNKGFVKQGKDFDIPKNDDKYFYFKDNEDWYWTIGNHAYTKITFV